MGREGYSQWSVRVKTWVFILSATGTSEGVRQGNDPMGWTFRKDCLDFNTREGKGRPGRPVKRLLWLPRPQALPRSPVPADASLQFWLRSPSRVWALAASYLHHFNATALLQPPHCRQTDLSLASWIRTLSCLRPLPSGQNSFPEPARPFP